MRKVPQWIAALLVVGLIVAYAWADEETDGGDPTDVYPVPSSTLESQSDFDSWVVALGFASYADYISFQGVSQPPDASVPPIPAN